MHFGMATKNKNQLSNYQSKHKSKLKNHSNSTSNNIMISEKELNRPMVDTFRKATLRENGGGFIKFKTTERMLNKADKSKDTRSLSGKQKENQRDQIQKLVQESIGDPFFKQKMQMMYKKQSQLKNDNSQLTYSNLYNQSNRMKLENSLYQKTSKNESFVKKKIVNPFDEELISNHNNNNGSSSPRIKNCQEINAYADNKAHLRVQSYNYCQSIKEVAYKNGNNNGHNNNSNNNQEISSSNNNSINTSNNHLNYNNNSNRCNNNSVSQNKSNSKTKKIISNSLLMNSNYNQHINSLHANKGKINGKIIGYIGSGNDMIRQFNKGSSYNNIGEYKKFNHTAHPTNQNSRKNSIDKSNPNSNINSGNNGISFSSSMINVINNSNYQYASKSSKGQIYSKRSSSSLMKSKKGSDDYKGKYQSISNYNNMNISDTRKNESNKSNEHYDQAFKPYGVNMNHNITPSPRITSSRLPMSKKEIEISYLDNNEKINKKKEIHNYYQNYKNTNEEVPNVKNSINFNDIKYEFVSSKNRADSASTKNTNIISNKAINKYGDCEKDFFLTKFKLNEKKNKSLTTVNSKPNSKTNSRIEDYLNNPTTKLNDDIYNRIGNKSDKDIKKHSIISNKKSSPVSMCQSPINKYHNEILKKVDEIKYGEMNQEIIQKKQINFMKYNECIRKSSEITENNKCNNYINKNNTNKSNNLQLNDIKSIAFDGEGYDIERMLNETNESIQSTARESIFYRKELEKVSYYIRQFYINNRLYPPSKIQFYKIGRLIGKGAFGKVNLALHICSGRLVAMKSFNKTKHESKHSKNKIQKEIDMLSQLKHPFVTQILDTFETDKYHVIVMEYICSDLLSYLKKHSKVSETSAKVIFKQIIEGLKFIHHNNIVHRDIKLDNILIDLDNTVKICDFGVSVKVTQGNRMHDHCGTPAYIAPEIFQKRGYEGFACDIWSVGVSLYHMITGTQPFKAINMAELQPMIESGKYEKLDNTFSPEVHDLIDKMLQVDPRKRITIKNILAHPWLYTVNIQNRSNADLFTRPEKLFLSKFNVDFLNSNKEDIIENFTMKNIITIIEENLYGNTKSFILAPFNSAGNYDHDDLFFGPDLQFENNNCKFGEKVKQLNLKYELNNNHQFDNGIIISQEYKDKDKDKKDNKNGKYDNSSSSSSKEHHAELDDYEDNARINNNHEHHRENCIDNDSNEPYNISDEEAMNERLLREIERTIGYNQRFLYDCLKNKEVNYATATYNLLNKFSNVKHNGMN